MYHGSPHRLTHLRAGSWVTPYREDAAVFGVPWSSEELASDGPGNGRPPQQLKFHGEPPPDHPVYVYRVEGAVRPAATNTGADYDWNHQVTKKTRVKLVETIPSWKEELMPFKSKRQARAAFAGKIPGIDPHEWAHETPDMKKLPERAPAEKGKATMRSKSRTKKAAAELFAGLEEELGNIFKAAALGSAVASPRNVGKLKGLMTTHAMKAPGYAASTQALNPGKSIVRAMNAGKPH